MMWRGASSGQPTAGEITNNIAAARLSVERWEGRGRPDVAEVSRRSLAIIEASARKARQMPTEEQIGERMAELRLIAKGEP